MKEYIESVDGMTVFACKGRDGSPLVVIGLVDDANEDETRLIMVDPDWARETAARIIAVADDADAGRFMPIEPQMKQ